MNNTKRQQINSESTIYEVCQYINNLKIKGFMFRDITHYFQKFCIDGKAFLGLKKPQLSAFGMFSKKRRNSLYDHIQKLKDRVENVDDEQDNINDIDTLSENVNDEQDNDIDTLSIDSDLLNDIDNMIMHVNSNVNTGQQIPAPPNHDQYLFNQLDEIPTSQPSSQLNMDHMNNDNSPQLNNSSVSSVINKNQIKFNVHAHDDHLVNYEQHSNLSPDHKNNQPINYAKKINQSAESSHKMQHQKNTISLSFKTEKCYFRCKRISKNQIKFIAVFFGINHNKEIFLLLSRRHIMQFNEIARAWSNNADKMESIDSELTSDISGTEDTLDSSLAGSLPQSFNTHINRKAKIKISEKVPVTTCDISLSQQVFKSILKIQKIHNGWQLNGGTMPFHSVCVVTFDFFRNEIVSLLPMQIEGLLNNVCNNYLKWVTCPLKIEAIQKDGTISVVKFDDNRKGHLDRHSSYLIHDWVYPKIQCKVNEKLKVCMKLFVKAKKNLKYKQKSNVSVQLWNVSKSMDDKNNNV